MLCRPDSKETDLDAIAKNTVEKRLGNNQLIPGIGHGIHTQGDPRAERLFQVAQETKVYGRYCDLLRKIGKLAEERVGRRLPVNVTGAIGAISMDMGLPWQMSKSFAILGRALGGIAHVGEEVRRPIARGISDLVRNKLAVRAGEIGLLLGFRFQSQPGFKLRARKQKQWRLDNIEYIAFMLLEGFYSYFAFSRRLPVHNCASSTSPIPPPVLTRHR